MWPYIPDWMLKLIVALCVIGGLTVIAGSIAGIFWLVNHIKFV